MHAGEDVIAGAVEDAIDPADTAAAQALAQGLDDRDAAGNRRLEIERRAVFLRQLGERDAVLGEQSLVGGDHRPPMPSAASTELFAGSPSPPISSTKTSMSGSRASATGSATLRSFDKSSEASLGGSLLA
jgi:hypothetical protein